MDSKIITITTIFVISVEVKSTGAQNSSATDPDGHDDLWHVERPNVRLKIEQAPGKSLREKLHTFFSDRAREDAYQKTEARDHPYSVIFLSRAKDKIVEVCTGSLISAHWVLTAAHCLVDCNANRIDILAGLSPDILNLPEKLPPETQHRKSNEYIAHPGYDPTAPNVDYDLALIKIDPGFKVTEFVAPVELVTSPWNHAGLRKCSLTAFGAVSDGVHSADDFIRKTQEMLVEKPCYCDYKIKRSLGREATSRYICMRPREDFGICSGDSGGGLICDDRLVAVTSLSFSLLDMYPCDGRSNARKGNQTGKGLRKVPIKPNKRERRSEVEKPNLCGDKDTMSVFQDVFPSLDWIKENAVHFEDSPSRGIGGHVGLIQSLNYCLFPHLLILFVKSFLQI